MFLREKMERLEREILSPYAFLSENSSGRDYPEEEDPYRTIFQRDKDRIIHSKAFRRLKHKTQVFIAPIGDHYRTRLTHTLEVSQISRSIARALRLNEDLTEAIALGHDLGHTPFGHRGEMTLNHIHPGGFRHNEQSLRVVELLEARPGKTYRGLNLSKEVREGILQHRSTGSPKTLEGQIIQLSDRIAYINHDLDDAFRAGALNPEDLPKKALSILGETSSQRMDCMIHDVILNSYGKDRVSMSEEVYQAMMLLRSFLFENLYLDSAAKSEDEKADYVLRRLYEHFSEHVELLPKELIALDPQEAVKDYIAGMSDDFAIKIFQDLFVPKRWG